MKDFAPLLILCLFVSFLSAQNPIIDLSKLDSSGITIIGQLQYFEDKGKNLTIQEIAKLPNDAFQTLPEASTFRPQKKWNRWFKLTMENPSSFPQEVMLVHRKMQNTSLHFFKENNWQQKDVSYNSKNRNYLGNQIDFELFSFSANQKKSFFFEFKYGNNDFFGTIYPVGVGWQKNYDHIQDRFLENVFRGGFLLVIFVFSLFNFFQYFQHKDQSYLLYSLYLFSILFCYFWRYGRYIYTPFTPLLSDFWEIVYAPTYYLIIVVYLFFFRSFLTEDNSKERKLRQWLKYSAVMVSTFLVLDLIFVTNGFLVIGRDILYVGNIILMVGFFVLLYKIFQLSYAATRYIGFGTLCIFIMGLVDRWKFWGQSIITDNRLLDFWGRTGIPADEMPVAILIEIIFFGLALGYRTKLIQEKTQEAIKDKEIEAAKSQLLTNITHEFRTPLSIIKGNANAILRHPKSRLIEKTQHIIYKTDYLASLVDEILNLSKLEVRKIWVTKNKGDLVAYLSYLTEAFRAVASEYKISLLFQPQMTHWNIDFSEKAMQQIVGNLILNALKFTPQRGKVKIILQNFDNQIVIKISDTGKGISSEDLVNIFDPFFQVEQTAENTLGGTGLGLAIVRQTVHLLNGKIEVESVLKKGTAFLIKLPATYEAENFPENKGWQKITLPQKTPKRKEKNIQLGMLPKLLVVEDNLELQDYYYELLNSYYTLIFANNGEEGLKMTQIELPDFIISDEMMPTKSGFDMLKALKNTPEIRHIPVIMITAKTARKYELKGLNLQAEAYLPKPIDEEKLLTILKNLETKNRQLEANKKQLRWKEKIVTDAFMKAVIFLLEDNFEKETFNTTRLKFHLQKQGFGGDRKLDHQIKKHFNTTPAKLIKQFRLEKAKVLLQTHKTLSIVEISEQVGLGGDQANFSKIYKIHFGKTPASERKQLIINKVKT